MKKAGFVGLIGRPNVGKSTLTNRFIGEYLCITSPKPQTTRDKIFGIYFKDSIQIIFQDLPGFLKAKNALQEKMVGDIEEGLKDSDIILFMVECNEDIEEYGELIELIKNRKNVFLVVNKVDKTSKGKDVWRELGKEKGWPVFLISALKGRGVKTLLTKIKENIPEVEEYYYDKDYITDRSERFIVKEYIRECSLDQYRDEIPHEMFIDISEMKEDDDIIRIEGSIFVARESQKIIILGKKGNDIKNLGIAAREKIEDFFKKKVFLRLKVKVRKKWFNDKDIVASLNKDYGVWK